MLWVNIVSSYSKSLGEICVCLVLFFVPGVQPDWQEGAGPTSGTDRKAHVQRPIKKDLTVFRWHPNPPFSFPRAPAGNLLTPRLHPLTYPLTHSEHPCPSAPMPHHQHHAIGWPPPDWQMEAYESFNAETLVCVTSMCVCLLFCSLLSGSRHREKKQKFFQSMALGHGFQKHTLCCKCLIVSVRKLSFSFLCVYCIPPLAGEQKMEIFSSTVHTGHVLTHNCFA